MQIGDLTPLATAMTSGWYLSPESRALPIIQSLAELKAVELRLFIGPEGGWTDAEQAAFDAAGLTPVRLTDTILRMETAAVAAAAVVMCSR
jgi:RsmE family RNA methyltransferase